MAHTSHDPTRQSSTSKTRAFRFALLVLLAPVMTGCFGTYPLTSRAYEANKAPQSRFFQQFMYVGMNMFLIYPGAYIIDTFFVNWFTLIRGDTLEGAPYEGEHAARITPIPWATPETSDTTPEEDETDGAGSP